MLDSQHNTIHLSKCVTINSCIIKYFQLRYFFYIHIDYTNLYTHILLYNWNIILLKYDVHLLQVCYKKKKKVIVVIDLTESIKLAYLIRQKNKIIVDESNLKGKVVGIRLGKNIFFSKGNKRCISMYNFINTK